MGMVATEGLFADGEGALEEGFGFAVVPHIFVQCCQVIEARGNVGMVATQGLFVDG